ncbi:MAG: DUF763 domain-containing protein, partial [Candidatus Omnitrophota bacterium]
IRQFAEKFSFSQPGDRFVYYSKISAKVDNTALQDGYQLYHHTFIVDRAGRWVVVQQGMNEKNRWARRYHWLGEDVKDFVCEPHKGVVCDHAGRPLNMVAKESEGARKASAEISRQDPGKIIKEYKRIGSLELPARHNVIDKDIKPENLRKILLSTYEQKPKDFTQLLGMRGVGPGTIRALALISELVYGEKPSFRDPVRFSFAHGGKDGHPYPVNRRIYDSSIQFLKSAVSKAKIGQSERMKAFKRLSVFER